MYYFFDFIFMLNTRVTIWTSTTQVVASSTQRVFLSIQNNSDENIYLAFGGDDAVIGQGMFIAPGGALIMQKDEDKYIINEEIQAICTTGGKDLLLITKV